jgi:hypothetical protein
MKQFLRSPVLEIFLGEVIVYLLLWLWNDYIATMVTITFILIFSAIWVISKFAEYFSETTPVPKSYFYSVLVSVIAPIVSYIIAYFIIGISVWTPAS